jgi:RNA polymerase sigma-70 factor (ECF subfamily)
LALSIDILEDDAMLVRAVQAGDISAYAVLFERHYLAVRRACARRLRDLGEADEVAQAAFVRAFERIDRCGGERRFRSWVHVIAHRLCLDVVRARSRTTPTAEPLPPTVATNSSGPEESVLRKERAADLDVALDALPPRQRQVVVARDLDGRAPGEIAAALGLSVAAVDSLLLRARRRLAITMRAASSESGLASLPTTAAATAASSAAAGPLGLVRALDHAWRVSSFRLASALGLVPGAPSAAHQVTAVVVSGAVAIAAGSIPAPPKASQPPAILVRAAVRPVTAGAPLDGLSTRAVVAPAVSPPTVTAPGVPSQALPSPPVAQPPAVSPPAMPTSVVTPVTAQPVISVPPVSVPRVTLPPVSVPVIPVPVITVPTLPPITLPPLHLPLGH